MPVESVMEHERIWIEGLNRGDVSVADAVFAPDCVVHMTGVADPLRAVGPWKELVAGLLRAFPDLHFTIEDQLAEGDKVTTRWLGRGTHSGEYRGFPQAANPIAPTDRPVDFGATDIYLIKNGKIAEEWNTLEEILILRQIGGLLK